MLDFSGLLDRASELFNSGKLEDVLGSDLVGRLNEQGIDASMLEGGQLDDIQNLMENSGVDLSALDETQLNDLIATVQENGGLEGLDLSSFLDQSSR